MATFGMRSARAALAFVLASLAPRVVASGELSRHFELIAEGKPLPEAELRARGAGEVEDVSLGVKSVLREDGVEEARGPNVATEVAGVAPPGGDVSAWRARGAFIFSEQWEAATVRLSLRGTWTGREGAGHFEGLALEGPGDWALRPSAELAIERDAEGTRTVSALVRAVWKIGERLSVDAAARRGRRGREGLIELRAGLTWALGAKG